MYARLVKGNIKPGKINAASQLFKNDVIPLLKKQHGFRDEITCFTDGVDEGYAISFWDNKADLERYESSVYPQVRSKMADLFQGQPTAEKFEVVNSTCHHIHAT